MGRWKDLTGSIKIVDEGFDKKTKKLLERFPLLFAHYSRRYFDITKENAFYYNERQVGSIVFPAFDDICEAVFLEQPIKRLSSTQTHSDSKEAPTSRPSIGRADYWMQKDGEQYVLELKHGWVNAQTGWFWASEKAKWEKLVEQVQTIVSKNKSTYFSKNNPGTAVGLYIVVHYAKQSDLFTSTEEKRKNQWTWHCNLRDKLMEHDLFKTSSENKNTQLWSALWKVPIDMRGDKNSDDRHPAISFFAFSIKSKDAIKP